MKKRLRKKKHLGEFAVFGVSLRVRCVPDLTEDRFDELLDGFIVDSVEAEGLFFGGGGSAPQGWSGVLEPPHGHRSIDPGSLARVTAWLSSRPEAASVEVSKPWDLWHGRDPFEREIEPSWG